jgi:hypothetical protein
VEKKKNNDFFHKYVNYGKNINSIWKIDKGDAMWETNFKDITTRGVNYFASLFKEECQAIITEVIRLSNFFPSFVNREDN